MSNNVKKRPLLLIKCGGSIVNNNTELKILLDNIALLKNQGFDVVIVHGGGPDINQLCDQLQVDSQFINGQRVTSLSVLEVTKMALLGKVNCTLTHKLNLAKVKAIGLSGHDANLLIADFINQAQLGYVGQVKLVNTDLIYSLLALGITPVIASLGVDNKGNTYNINADLVAGSVAGALGADKLILLSDIDGFYRDFKDKNSLVKLIDTKEVSVLLKSGQINGGMIPKLSACEIALDHGVKSAHIINGNNPEGLVTIATTGSEIIGTTVINEV